MFRVSAFETVKRVIKLGSLGGRDNPHFVSAQDNYYIAGDPSIIVTDVITNGPAYSLVQ